MVARAHRLTRIALLTLCCVLAQSALWAQSTVGAQDVYEFVGKIVQIDGKPFRGVAPVIFLQGAVTPFTASTLAGPTGEFKFRKLLPGMYTLIISVPQVGTMQKTIEIGPSFADAKKRIKTTFHFEGIRPTEEAHRVTVGQLSVPDQARRDYEKALERLEKRDIPGAVSFLKKAIELAPHFSQALNHLGTIAYQSKDFRQAENYFREAIKHDPSSYPPLVNLGGALLSQGRAEESLEFNLQAVRTRPDDALAHSQLGQSYFLLNQLENAERHLKQAKALDPAHFSFPQLVLAEIYARLQNDAVLIAELEDFLKQHPDSELAPKLRELLEQVRSGQKKALPQP